MKLKATIIMPCAGKSKRYPSLRPKFLLVNPNGNLMLIDALSKLPYKSCKIIVTVLKEHEQKYEIRKNLNKFFAGYGIELCVLKQETKSQSETVYKTLKQMNLKGPFLVKDSDNIFNLDRVYEPHNYVPVESLENAGLVNASNKSYAQTDSSGIIVNIEEKKVISNTFSVGGYYFLSPAEFIEAYETLAKMRLDKEIYVSMVISHMMFKMGKKFKTKQASEYVDLGTIKEWVMYKEKFKTYFIDIDGVVVKNSAEYFKPYWGTTQGISENVAVIKELYARGNQIILTTTRKESYRKITEKQLKKVGVPYNMLIMELFHSGRVLINDFSNSNPYPSAVEI